MGSGRPLARLTGSLEFGSGEASTETELPTCSISEPQLDTRTAVAVADADGDWLCAWCMNRIAVDCDRFKYEGKDHFAFSNPEGLSFRIITFSRTIGCTEEGVPSLEHTWFPGHVWSFCQCDQCGQHLGWFYAGEHHFVGLIIDRLVRGTCVRN